MLERWKRTPNRTRAAARRGLCAAALTLPLSLVACASTPHAVREPMPVYAQAPVQQPPAYVVYPPPQPRVIIAAPPPAGAPSANNTAQASASNPSTPAGTPPAPPQGYTPQASPLLAAFDSSPHGQPPTLDPYVQEVQGRAAARQLGWSSSWYRPYYSGYAPSYGYGGYGGYGYGYGYPRYGYGYGYPGAFGLGVGLGLGWGGYGYGYGRGYYGGHYYGHGGGYGGYGHGGGYGGGHHGGGGGHHR